MNELLNQIGGPFDPDIWGNVSEWVMVGVTAVTAWFLWHTLRSQQAIQKMQQRITDIEVKKQKRESEPFLEAQVHKVDLQAREDPSIVLHHGVLWQVAFEFTNISSNVAYNLFARTKSEGWKPKGSRTIQKAVPGQSGYYIQLEGLYKTNRKSFTEKAEAYNCEGPDMVLDLYFTDFRDEPYRQSFQYRRRGSAKVLTGNGIEPITRQEWLELKGQ